MASTAAMRAGEIAVPGHDGGAGVLGIRADRCRSAMSSRSAGSRSPLRSAHSTTTSAPSAASSQPSSASSSGAADAVEVGVDDREAATLVDLHQREGRARHFEAPGPGARWRIRARAKVVLPTPRSPDSVTRSPERRNSAITHGEILGLLEACAARPTRSFAMTLRWSNGLPSRVRCSVRTHREKRRFRVSVEPSTSLHDHGFQNNSGEQTVNSFMAGPAAARPPLMAAGRSEARPAGRGGAAARRWPGRIPRPSG